MNQEEKQIIQKYQIRTHFDNQNTKWYFSIVDVIGNLADTTDPRNYWKVLKNRLNKTQKELVTRCNQLKMPAKDGKMYLTDATDADTLLEIIEIVSPSRISDLREFLYQFEDKSTAEKLYEETEFELPIDAYQDDKNIVIKAMIAGVKVEDLFISVSMSEVIINGKRSCEKKENVEDVFYNELVYGTFSKTITLPEEVNIDEAHTTLSHGLLTLTLPKINKDRKRILKIKSE